MLHAVDAPNELPDVEQVHSLETLSRLVGARLGLLRAMHRTSLQAATDALTGLANRRTLEEAVRELFEQGQDFSLAVVDLDNFKLLNDTHGHEAGDRALRLFSRTMRDAVRPNDLVARYGGEEFLIVLRGASIIDAMHALERVRRRLAERLTAGTTPVFTASFGLVHSTHADRFDELFSEPIKRCSRRSAPVATGSRSRVTTNRSAMRPTSRACSPSSATPRTDPHVSVGAPGTSTSCGRRRCGAGAEPRRAGTTRRGLAACRPCEIRRGG